MLNFRPFFSAAVSIALATPAIAADATLIVDRSAQSVALYFKMAATDLRRIFGMGAEGLPANDGTVDVRGLMTGRSRLPTRFLRKYGSAWAALRPHLRRVR